VSLNNGINHNIQSLDIDTIEDEDELASSNMSSSNNSNFNDNSSSFTDQVKDTASQAFQQTQQAAGQMLDKAKDTVKDQLSTQKDRATDSMGGFTDALHQTGQQLRQNGQGAFGDYADSLASQVDRAVGFLRERDVDQLVSDVENFARKQPALFIGGAVLLGIAVGRFLKSSSPAPQNQFTTATNPNSLSGSQAPKMIESHIPERVYENADTSRHLDQFSDDALPSNAPLSAHDYVPGFPPQGESSTQSDNSSTTSSTTFPDFSS
jgi:gas vesicle protein